MGINMKGTGKTTSSGKSVANFHCDESFASICFHLELDVRSIWRPAKLATLAIKCHLARGFEFGWWPCNLSPLSVNTNTGLFCHCLFPLISSQIVPTPFTCDKIIYSPLSSLENMPGVFDHALPSTSHVQMFIFLCYWMVKCYHSIRHNLGRWWSSGHS